MRRPSFVFVRAAVVIGLTAVVAVGTLVIWRSSRAMRSAAEDVRAQSEFRFTVRPLAPALNTGFEAVSAPAVFLQAARFQDHLYIAGPAGLQEYTPYGTLIHQYAAGSELPGSPLVALAPAVLADSHEPELIVATAGDGILAFNGRSYRQILPAQSDALAITAILPVASGHLLIGTKKRGVLVFDGKHITVLHPTLDALYVTALAGNESDLWVATLNRGVLHFSRGRNGELRRGSGIARSASSLTCDFGRHGLCGHGHRSGSFQRGKILCVLAPGLLATALLATPTQLYVGSEDRGVMVIPLLAVAPIRTFLRRSPALGACGGAATLQLR